jgi:AcrR family transcriptional regulator/DNA-binding MarR family transcriptional regulator
MPRPVSGRVGAGGGERSLRLIGGGHRLYVSDIQRSRILAAMIEVGAARGAASTTVAEVVSRAGVSRRTFYEVFSDGEDCLLAALDYTVRLARERVEPAYDSQVRWRERMRAGLIALLAFLDDEPSMARLLIVESLGAGPRVLEFRDRVMESLVAAIDAGRGEVPPRERELPSLVGEWTVGAVASILHAHIVKARKSALVALAPELMSLIVLPYHGPAAARAELRRQVLPPATGRSSQGRPLSSLSVRITYRTLRVLIAIAEHPGASNRAIGRLAGIEDQGQISKLLARLQLRGLIENGGDDRRRGGANEWKLTPEGDELHRLMVKQAGREHG